MCRYMKNLEDRSVRFMGVREGCGLLSKWKCFSQTALCRVSSEGRSDRKARGYIVYGSHTPAFCIFPNFGPWKGPFASYSHPSTFTFSAIDPLQGPFFKCTTICSILAPFFSDSHKYDWPDFLQPSHLTHAFISSQPYNCTLVKEGVPSQADRSMQQWLKSGRN